MRFDWRIGNSPSDIHEAFQQDGFVVFPELFSRLECQHWKDEIRRILDRVRQRPESNQHLEQVGVYVGLAAASPVFYEAVGDDRLRTVLQAILGPAVEFLSDKVVFKSQTTRFGSPWHQDWPYWRGSHKISVWIPLDDATRENGTLKLLPGSHRSFVPHDGKADNGHGFGHRLEEGAVDESQAVAAELPAGSAVFFHDLTLHASYPNQTGADRWVWIPTYRRPAEDDPDYPWAVAAHRIDT